ncbi:DUF3293 domain-containing protein [Vibrio aquaticus]|nr:DUF3293 domain-containing protein [Vibrio aquaticus]
MDDALWQTYCDPYFRFESQLHSENFAIITAWNPASVWLSNIDNTRNNQHLEKDISHTCYSHVLVGDKTFTWAEASFATAMSLEEALELGKKYQQNAIYYVQGEALFLISCLRHQRSILHGKWQERCR